jgi:hypothetical protein
MKASDLPWASVKTLSGTGERLLASILALGAAEERTRMRAYWQLDNVVVVQADLFEAAAFTALALIEVMPSFEVDMREQAYTLLYELASGHAPPDELVDAPGLGTIPLKSACTAYVRRGLPMFLDDVRCHNPRVRREVRDLLIRLAEEDPEIRGRLRSVGEQSSGDVALEIQGALKEIDE